MSPPHASNRPEATRPEVTRREVILDLARRNAIWRFLGVELLEAEPGKSLFAMTVKPEHTNSFGAFHGGQIFALADLAFGFTCNAANTRAVSAGASIEFLAPANLGDRLIAEAVEIHREGRNALYDVRIRVETTGVTVAVVRGRMRLIGGLVMEPAEEAASAPEPK